MNTDLAGEIVCAIQGVTKDWARQRKAEERDQSRARRRREALVRSRHLTVKEVAYEIMAAAYQRASSGGTLPAHARQIMYAARGDIQSRTGRTLSDQYFCQTLLPDYLAEHPTETDAWDVVFDARGHLEEPHTQRIVPLGTIDVRDYLDDIATHTVPVPTIAMAGGTYPTLGPRHRFAAILFVEKEGFLPLFQSVHLAERYDMAIMSTKGLSVTAARLLVESLCSAHEVPLMVLHDFDKSGFSIIGTLRRNTRRYSFTRAFEVIELGLRLADVRAWQLESEAVSYARSDPRPNLRENGATEEEIRFLCSAEDWQGYYGERVELNAFTSRDLVEWIESKLEENGILKVVPDQDTLATAYRRAVAIELLQQRTAEISRATHAEAEQTRVPKALAREVRRQLEEDPGRSWDQAVAKCARERVAKSARAAQAEGRG
jgi:hypothetical protein